MRITLDLQVKLITGSKLKQLEGTTTAELAVTWTAVQRELDIPK